MSDHLNIGLQGELFACTYLEGQGYRILEKNWRYQRAEIDIICLKGGHLVFVEVKTRTSDFLGDPASAVSRSKQKHLIRAADAYVKRFDGDPEIRFDIVGLVINKSENRVEHITDAFYPVL
ncbi:MAG: YraN family protein [Flavobacteriales bacterium]|nr:YraN family protein [Flavobacteriales bacterium]